MMMPIKTLTDTCATVMDVYENARYLAECPHTPESLEMIQCIVKAVSYRYPRAFSSKTGTHFAGFSSPEGFPASEPSIESSNLWEDFMYRLSARASHPDEFRHMTSYLWDFLQYDVISKEMVESYVTLLRPLTSKLQLQCPVSESALQDENLQKDMIQPLVLSDGSWGIAVIYVDTIHWFSYSQNDEPPEQIATWATNHDARLLRLPTQLHENTSRGALEMLLDIFSLSKGYCVNREVSGSTLQAFRVLVFMQLMTMMIKPDDESFQELLHNEYDLASSHFQGALDEGALLSGNNPAPNDSESSSQERSPRQLDSSARCLSKRRKNGIRKKTTTCRDRGRTSTGQNQGTTCMDIDCRTILRILSKAVAFQRMTRTTLDTDISILWAAVQNQKGSEFYRRLNAVYLYQQLEERETDGEVSLALTGLNIRGETRQVRDVQACIRIWHELFEAGVDILGDAGVVVLCIVPDRQRLECLSRSAQLEFVTRTRARLRNASDPLRSYLEQASHLCLALINDRLPKDPLIIDTYYMKEHQNLESSLFTSFTSLDPRPKVQITRAIL